MFRVHIVLASDGVVKVFSLLIHLDLSFGTFAFMLVRNIFGSVILIRLLSFVKIVGYFLTRFLLGFLSLYSSFPVTASHEHIDILNGAISLICWIAIVVSATNLLHFDRLVAIVIDTVGF